MHLGKLGRGLAAMTVIVALSAACTPDPGLTPTPSPSAPATPTETEQERQERIAYEAAEKSYREFRAEYNRVLQAGGADKPTKTMKAGAGGAYLTDVMEVAEAYKGFKYRRSGVEKNVYVRGNGLSADALALEVCEDTTGVRTLDSEGKAVGRGEIQKLNIEMQLKDAKWKAWSGTGKKVDSCE